MTEYQAKFARDAYLLALDNKSDEDIARWFKLTLRQYLEWLIDYPDFASAVEKGAATAEYMAIGERFRRRGSGGYISGGPLTIAPDTGVGRPSIINGGLLSQSAFQTIITNAKNGVAKTALMLGDSIGFGYGSQLSAPSQPKSRYMGTANQVAASFAAAGLKASAQGWFADGLLHATGNARQYDDRISQSVDAWSSGGVNTIGGQNMFATATATRTFTPSINCDCIDIYYLQVGGAGHFSYQIDGGAAVDVNAAGSNSMQKIAITGLSLGSHTLTLNWVSGFVYWMGADAYNSASVGLKFINGAINGGFLSDFTANSNVWDALKVCATLAPAMAFMVIGANHWNTAGSLSTFSTDLQTIITAFGSICPLVLVSDIPSDPAGPPSPHASLASQQTYVDAMVAAARTNNLLMFDEWSAFGGLNAPFNSDWMASDHIHPSSTGYTRMAGHISAAFLAAA